MSASLSDLRPELQPFARALVDAAGAAGLMPRVTSTRRSHAEQERLYRRYLAGQQPYPVARPGTSAHEYGWAFDMVVSPMDALYDVGAYWEGMGGVWGGHPGSGGGGGRSVDPVHFEYPGWRQFVNWNAPDNRLLRDIYGGAVDIVENVNPLGSYGAKVDVFSEYGPIGAAVGIGEELAAFLFGSGK